MELSIIAQISKYLDEASHAIADGDRQTAIDRLQDVKEAVKTLQGLCRLPCECRAELEIWQ